MSTSLLPPLLRTDQQLSFSLSWQHLSPVRAEFPKEKLGLGNGDCIWEKTHFHNLLLVEAWTPPEGPTREEPGWTVRATGEFSHLAWISSMKTTVSEERQFGSCEQYEVHKQDSSAFVALSYWFEKWNHVSCSGDLALCVVKKWINTKPVQRISSQALPVQVLVSALWKQAMSAVTVPLQALNRAWIKPAK